MLEPFFLWRSRTAATSGTGRPSSTGGAMARYCGKGADAVYAAAATFLQDCLINDGSLFHDGAHLWQTDVLQTLQRAFKADPDAEERHFLPKFRGQIGEAGPDVIRLAAELLSVYFLFPANVGGKRKREVVQAVLDWAGDSLPGTHPVARAFDHGIGSGGQGYNTRRPFELAFLIEFARQWKAQPLETRRETAQDPWKFQGFLDGVDGAESVQLRHMLPHLLFPDTFERIASGNHKRRVIAAFGASMPGEYENEDRHLCAIRTELESTLQRDDLDFYHPPLADAWYTSDAGGREDEVPLGLIRHKKQVVFYGPPGTGKTHGAKQLAALLIKSAALARKGALHYFKSQPEIDDIVKKNIHRLQLHPAYSYEDFVRGLHIAPGGGTEYRPGYLLRLIEAINAEPEASRLPHILILDEMNRTDLSRMLGECFSLLEDRGQGVELPGHTPDGAPLVLRIPADLYIIGTMNLIDQSVEQIDFALRRRFLWKLCPFDAEALKSVAEAQWNALHTGLEWERVAEDFDMLAQAATALNTAICSNSFLGGHYEIGHTYFLDVVVFLRDFLGPRPAGKRVFLWNKKGEALEPVIQVWKLSIRPLLEQYLAGLDAEERAAALDVFSETFLRRKGNAQ